MSTLHAACGGDFARVLFLDESGAKTDLARTHGRSAVGSRCLGSVPRGHWKITTAVAAIGLRGMRGTMTLDGAMDGEAFRTYVEQVLAIDLRSGDVVVMDNLPAHKAAGVAERVQAAGATLLYLPPYSPDYNPIEMIWSKVKKLLRDAAARTVDTLREAIGDALAAVTLGDIGNCFRHCGYHPPLETT